MTQMTENIRVYTTKDFEALNWHDCKIYGLAFDDVSFKFYLDIDLIIEWINPIGKDGGYKYKIASSNFSF